MGKETRGGGGALVVSPRFSTAALNMCSSLLNLAALHHLHSRLRGLDKSASANWNTAGGAVNARARLAAPKTLERC